MNSEAEIIKKGEDIRDIKGETGLEGEQTAEMNKGKESVKQEDKKEVKLQFRFSGEAVDRLDEIVKKSRLVSRAELIRNAVRLYEYVVEQMDAGYEVELVKGRKRGKIFLLTR